MLSKNPDDLQQTTALTRREALAVGASAGPLLVAGMRQATAADNEGRAVGPILGHVDHETAMIWYRPSSLGEYVATITHTKTGKTHSSKAVSSRDHDLCITWRFDDLEASSDYTYAITHQGQPVAKADIQRIRSRQATVPTRCRDSKGATSSEESCQELSQLNPHAAHRFAGMMIV